jgi:hypothetical protein
MPLKRPIYFVALDRLAPTYRKKYAFARRFLARLVSGTFLTGMTESFSKL